MDTPQPNDEIHAQIGDNASGIAVGKQITQNVTQHFYNQPAPSTDPTLDFATVEQRYRAQVVKYYNKLALTGLPERDPGLHEITLEQIFIKLNIELLQPAGPDFLGFDDEYRPSGDRSTVSSAVEHKRHMREMACRPTPVTLSVAEALQRHTQLVIIGGPGSGKTTLTRWLAVVFARCEQAKSENLGTALAGDRLPIMLELRRFAEHFVTLSQQPVVPDLASEIASFISRHAYYPGTPAAFIQQALTDGRCLILLDGLDEIADLGARQLLTDAIHSFIQHPTQPYRNNLLLVTSRPHGYQSISLSAFQECEVKPFTLDDVALFIRHWYATAYPDQEQSEAADLTTAIKDNERVGELATNPLLCTIIAIVYRNNRVLPNRRVELYLKCCKALLDTWERNKALKTAGLIAGYDWQTKLELLAPVAYWLHNEAERLAAPEADFVKQLAQVLIDKKLGDPAKAEQEARQFIALIRDRSGLLQGRGDGTLEFTHRTFQEYLAARHIAAQPYPDYIDWVMVHLHEAWWREVHLLVIGCLGSSSTTADRATALLQAILAYIPPPWPWLRSCSLKAQTPRWLLQLSARAEDANRLIVSMVKTIRVIILSPYIICSYVAWLWPRWQLAQRLAWLLNREWAFVVQGYLDCIPVGVHLTLAPALAQRTAPMLTQLLYVENYYGNLPQKQLKLLGNLQRSIIGHPVAITIAITALHDPDPAVRSTAAYALGQLGQADTTVITALLTALKDSEMFVWLNAAASLRQLSHIDPTATIALRTTLHDRWPSVWDAASTTLGQLNVQEQHLLNQRLVGLNRHMHLLILDDKVRQKTLHAIDEQLEGRPLPGYRWIPIRTRLERQRRINQFGWWAWLVCGLVLAALVVVYLSARLDADNLLVRFGAAVALITGLAAGVAQVLDWTLRNPYGKHEP